MDDQSCDCCEGTQVLTPVTITNRPGLAALAYRVGTHARFLETMKAKLSSQIVDVPRADDATQSDNTYPLRNLATRTPDDPAIALLDGWATVAEVLTFYQERIANEGYLRTATERRSVLELARLVGYALRPGVASTVYLAYTIDDKQTTPAEIPVGARSQSLPNPGELPQSFETSEALDARASWNTLNPRLTQPQTIDSINNRLFSLVLWDLEGVLDTLNRGSVPLELQKEFEKHGIFLSSTGTTVSKEGSVWQISDSDQHQSYVVIAAHSGTSLNIHLSQNDRVYLKGISTNLKPNDPLLIVSGGGLLLFRVKEVKPDAAADRTLIIFQSTAGLPPLTGLRSMAYKAVAASTVGAQASGAYADIQRTYAQALEEIATRHSDPNQIKKTFKVDPTSGMAGRVIQILTDLRAQAAADMPPARLAELLQNTSMVQLRQALTTAADAGYTRLESWISAIISDLDQVTTNILKAVANVAPPEEAAAYVPKQVSKSEDVLLNVIQGLSKPPSVPPPNTLQLARSVEKSFAANNDSGLQVVNALRPDFKTILPLALMNVQVTQSNPLEMCALRLKTGVYGSTAPLKLDKDREGIVTGTSEWPIAGILTIQVSLFVESGRYLSNSSTIKVTAADETFSTTVELDDSGEVTEDLGPDSDKVHFKFGQYNNNTENVEYRSSAGNVQLTYQVNNDYSVGVTVSVGGESKKFTVKGDAVKAVMQSHTFTIDGGTFMGGPVSVIDEPPRDVISLDATYDAIAPQTYYVVQRPGHGDVIGTILNVQTVAKTAYNFPAKVTQLTLDQDWLTADDKLLSDIRSTTVFVQSEKLELAQEPIDPIKYAICGGKDNEIELDGVYSDLKSGRWLIVAGARSDITTASKDVSAEKNVVADLESAELVMLAGVRHGLRQDSAGRDIELPGDKTHTFITLATKLSYCYQRDKVTLYGNVVKATHGESRNELLGNGDGSRSLQSFDLKQPPLTYVAAPNPSGVDSTLHVYVNDVEWHEADALAGLARTDHKFITRTNDEGKTTVIFGNGQQGARLPTGAANMRAVYRNGIGKPGNVQAKQISLLVSRPLGVKDVINPLRASGGADKETRDQARKNVPLAVTALDRLVSVPDYADFARTFAGIAKASARRMSDGKRELVHITIAGVDNVPIDPSSDLYRNLLKALHDYGDPDLPVRVDVRELLTLVIKVTIYLQADYVWEKVVSEVRAKLLDTFSFDRRELGQDAVLSEAIAAMQAVRGVAYVDVEVFGAIPEKRYDNDLQQRRLLTPQEITAFVQQMIASKSESPSQLLEVQTSPITAEAPQTLPVWLRHLLLDKQPLDRIIVELADLENGTLRPAQLAFLSPLVPDTLILNRG